MAKVCAFDLSLNHGAAVQLHDGLLTDFWFYTDSAGVAAKDRLHGRRHALPSRMEKQILGAWRLAKIASWLDRVLDEADADFWGAEDYAYGAAHGAHQLGEAGGILRLKLWERNCSFRLHDPVSLKMYVTGSGTASKDAVWDQVAERWGYNFDRLAAGKDTKTPEDLYDAAGLARLVDLEAGLRSGVVAMTDLESDKERQVFNRTTKTYPLSILAREWIQRESASAAAGDV